MDIKPTYDITKDYYYNFEHGPFYSGDYPTNLKVESVHLFGKKVDFPLGVPAGLLLNGRWVETYGKLGFPVLVYKTVRSCKYPCHPYPNCLYVKTAMIDPDDPPEYILAPKGYVPESYRLVTITNSFGMPSMDPEWWQEDIASLKRRLPEGCFLIGSGVGTHTGSTEEIAEDFVRVAEMLAEVGVDAVELNFSCPNVKDHEGSIYMDPELSAYILAKVKKAVPYVPLLVKIGLLIGDKLREFVRACAPYVEGVAGINSFQARVVDEMGKPALGEDREKSGVCGWALRRCALRFTAELRKIRDEIKADFLIFSCGGVTDRESYKEFINAGAHVVMSCTGAMFNPLLAREIRGGED